MIYAPRELTSAGELPDSLPGRPPERFPGILVAPNERRPHATGGSGDRGAAAAHWLHARSSGNRVAETRSHVSGSVSGRDRVRPQGIRDWTGAGPDPGRPPR